MFLQIFKAQNACIYFSIFLFLIGINQTNIHAAELFENGVTQFRIGPNFNSNLTGASGFAKEWSSLFVSAGIRKSWFGFNPFIEAATLKPGIKVLNLGADIDFHFWFLTFKGGAEFSKIDTTTSNGFHGGASIRLWNIQRWLGIETEYNYRMIGSTRYHNVGLTLNFFLEPAPLRKAVVDNYAGLFDSLMIGVWEIFHFKKERKPFFPTEMPKLWPI